MSRFGEGDGFESEEEERDFDNAMRTAYATATPDLAGFLAYLDAMPRKRIIADRFMLPQTGDTCAVATFCAFKGFDQKKLRSIERQSAEKRCENDGVEDYWDSATVNAGVDAGPPELVAFNLASLNDMVWDTVQTGTVDHPGTKGRYDPNVAGGRVLVPDEENGTHWISRPWTERIYGEMTPEERWWKLRNHVAKKVGEATIPPPAEWPEFMRVRVVTA